MDAGLCNMSLGYLTALLLRLQSVGLADCLKASRYEGCAHQLEVST
jgi:hypothetical protein